MPSPPFGSLSLSTTVSYQAVIEAHEIYLEKSGKSREDAEQTRYINEKSDSAEDIIDEASFAIEVINKETFPGNHMAFSNNFRKN